MKQWFTDAVWPFAMNLALAVAIVAVIFAAAMLIVQKLASPIREALAKAALVLCVLCPVLVYASTSLKLGSLDEPNIPLAVTTQQASQSLQIDAPAQPKTKIPSVPMPKAGNSLSAAIANSKAPQTIDLRIYILAIWLFGAIFLSIKTLIGQRQLSKLARLWNPAQDESLVALLAEAGKAADWHEETRLLESETLAAPVCFIAGRPIVAVPTELSKILSEPQIRAAFIHECVHLKAKHQAWRRLSHFVNALYWWVAPLWLIKRDLEDAQEKICDSHVVRSTKTGRDLAECLVTLATRNGSTRTPSGAIAVFRRGQLEGRIRRLLDKGSNNMTTITKRSLMAIAAVAAAACLLAAKLQIGATSPPGSEYFPMVEGTTWTYKVSPANTDPWTLVREAYSLKSYQGMPVMEYRNSANGSTDFDYIMVRPDGAYEMSRQYKDMPGFRGQESDKPQLVFPPKVGATWTEKFEVPYQTLQIDGDPPPKHDPMYRYNDYRIVSDKEMVDTPFGRKRAVLVEMSSRESNGQNQLQVKSWICAGIGNVRQEVYDTKGNLVQSVALTNFQPADPTRATPTDPAKFVEAQGPAKSAGYRYQNIDNSDLRNSYRSRFVLASKEKVAAIYRVYGNTILQFDPTNPNEWNSLISQEMPKKRPSNIPGPYQGDIWFHLDKVALLYAASQGHLVNESTEAGSSDFSMAENSKIIYGRVKATGKDTNGKSWELTVLVTFDDGKITKIETR